MELEQIKEVMEEEIADLERGIYRFESVVRPRYETDAKILDGMRDQHIKLMSLIQKTKQGQDVTQQEILDVVPKQFIGQKNEEEN